MLAKQLVSELATLLDTYRDMLEVSSGNPEADKAYNDALEVVIGDIGTLVADATDAMPRNHMIPTGFRLHAVLN